MGFPFDSEQYSEFQINIFSNNRDIRKCQSFRMTLDDDAAAADDARAMTIPRRFLRKKAEPIKIENWSQSYSLRSEGTLTY